MNFDPDAIYTKVVKLGEEWADVEAMAQQLEESKKIILSQLKMLSEKTSEAAKETEALASEAYLDHIKGMVEARKKANKAKVRYIASKAWVDMQRTKQSNLRAEKNLL